MLYILTLNWNGKNKLEALYPTLIKSLIGIEYKWLIRDNGSEDNSLSLQNVWNNDNVNILKISHNRDGFATGCNFLFKEANPKENDLILLLNNDIIFNDTISIKNMIRLITNDDGIGAVGAKLNYTNTDKLQHCGVILNKRYNMLPYHYRLNEQEDKDARKNREFQAITGAVLLTRPSLYSQICKNEKTNTPGMDQSYFFCFEDIDLCFSIKYNLRKKIVYCGETNIFHEESYSLKKNNYNKLFLKHNVDTFLKKWQGKYNEDHQLYLNNKNYNLYKGNSK